MVIKIYQGNCLDILPNLQNNSINLIITDPPFNIGKKYGNYKDNLSKNEYIEWEKKWLIECKRVLTNDGSMYLFNYPENNARIFSFIEDNFYFRRWLVWNYNTNIGHSKTNFTRSHRSILFFTKSKEYYFNRSPVLQPYKNPNDKRIQERIKNGSEGRMPYCVFNMNLVKNVSNEKTNHPCQVPIELLKIFIQASSKENDTIMDIFSGSFSTGVAAKQLNRNFTGIELNPEYCEIGRRILE